MRIGSLFSGIGGLELGLERAGVGHTVWQVEQNEYCLQVLARHWPDAVRFTDVRTVGNGNLAPVDVICGGFPCQDISTAGSGAGLGGARSALWSEYRRIVGELRPSYVVVENVAALLVRGLDVVLGELAALGYDAWWDCVPAVAVGAPHRRDRLFLVAYANHGLRRSDGRGVGAGEGSLTGAVRERCVDGQRRPSKNAGSATSGAAAADTAGDGRRQGFAHGRGGAAGVGSRKERGPLDSGRWWAVEPDVGRVAHGVPARVDRLRALGNAVVPQVAEVVGRVLLQIHEEIEAGKR